MKKTILFICAALASQLGFAQVVDKVLTGKGEEYVGYICEQTPGKEVLVKAQYAKLRLQGATIVRDVNIPVSSLDSKISDILSNYAAIDTVTYCTIEAPNGAIYDNAYIISKSGNETYFVTLSDGGRTFRIKWTDIYKTEKILSRDSYAYVKDVIQRYGEADLVGQIEEQIIGKSITIRTDDEERVTIPINQIISIRSEQVDKSANLWEGIELIDRVVLNNDTIIDGYIVSRVIGKEVKMLECGAEEPYSLSLSSIKKYQKVLNNLTYTSNTEWETPENEYEGLEDEEDTFNSQDNSFDDEEVENSAMGIKFNSRPVSPSMTSSSSNKVTITEPHKIQVQKYSICTISFEEDSNAYGKITIYPVKTNSKGEYYYKKNESGVLSINVSDMICEYNYSSSQYYFITYNEANQGLLVEIIDY